MSEDEYGDIEDDVWEQAFTQASQTLPPNPPHPRKRRRISPDDEVEDAGMQNGRRRQSRDSTGSGNEDESNEKKKKKYRMHYDAEEVPAAVIMGATQAEGLPDSSPYRIRGPIYRKPRPIPDPPPASIQKQAPFLQPRTTQKHVNAAVQVNDFSKELEDLPSDAFSQSPEQHPPKRSITITSSPPEFTQPSWPQRLVAPQNGLRQTTLFGGRAPDELPSASQAKKVHNYLVDQVPEPPTHHSLDKEAMQTWVYPTNLGAIRDYQYTIVHNGLFNNLLVALPTGLGKTFIAATIMLNYYRWTRDAQIVFVAPTKPLVSQQVKACFEIAGIPRSATTMLTGDQPPALRAEEWAQKRVFFMTPQTIDNDLKTGIADPKKIVLLVVDEAHRATGNYAYAKVVQFLRRFNKSFRVLALTATPGATVEAVQEVIDNLEISKVEIRTEESMDIRQFTHRRDVDEIVIDPSDEIIMIKELLSKVLQPLVNQLCSQNCYYSKDPMGLTQFGLVKARQAWVASPAGRSAHMGLKGMINALFTVLMSVAHAIKLLNYHGIGPFFSNIKDFRSSVEGNGGGKYKKQIVNDPDFKKMMDRIQGWINKEDFVGHPKLTHLCDTILNHFLDAGDGLHGDSAPPSSTRVIVFAEYRDSAEDIARVLNRHGPMIRASVFVGQSDSARSEGMNQIKQLETIRKFKAGIVNVIVATSIGEEGLDIGQVDLIVCYDSSSSPIRMLQRMGRTGRKRAGRIVLLLMRGKEEDSYKKSKDNYQQMQAMISSGARFTLRHDLSARIIPREIKPIVDKRIIEIPPENTQDTSLPEPRRRAKAKKKPAKKFHMPDGVETGFQKASKLKNGNLKEGDPKDRNPLEAFGITRKRSELNADELAPIPPLDSVILTSREMAQLDRRYLSVPDGSSQEVEMLSMTSQTIAQRSLTRTVKVAHGKYTKRCVNLFKTLSELQQYEDRDAKPYGDEPPFDLGSTPKMPLESDLRSNITTENSISPVLSKKAKAPKSAARTKQSRPSKKVTPRLQGHALREQIERELLLEDEDDDSDDSMASKTRESQLTQPAADSEEEGPGENVDRTSDMEDLHASEDSDIGSLEDFIDPTQVPTNRASSYIEPSSPRSSQVKGKTRTELGKTKNGNRIDMTGLSLTQETEDDEFPDVQDLFAGSKGREKERSSPRATPNMFMKKRITTYARSKQRRLLEDSDSDE